MPDSLNATRSQSSGSASSVGAGSQHPASPSGAAATGGWQDYTFTTVFLPEHGGGYTVFVPALPEVCGTGATFAEAELAARESIALALEIRRETGDAFPRDNAEIPILQLTVALPSTAS